MTANQIANTIDVVKAVGEAIRTGGPVPAGTLYAQMLGACSLEQFNQILAILIRAKLVARSAGHMLTWIGPRNF